PVNKKPVAIGLATGGGQSEISYSGKTRVHQTGLFRKTDTGYHRLVIRRVPPVFRIGEHCVLRYFKMPAHKHIIYTVLHRGFKTEPITGSDRPVWWSFSDRI